MNIHQQQYYSEMALKDRLFMFYHNDRKVCLITYFIDNDKDKYIREDMWQVLNDNPQGKICIIDHLLTDKNPINPKLSYKIWHYFKEHIRKNFPQVENIFWIRAKLNPNSLTRDRKTYIKSLKGVEDVHSKTVR